MKFIYDDGGRAAAGFKGGVGDCVARSVAIASGLPYLTVYNALAAGNAMQRKSKHDKARGRRTAAHGIKTQRKWFKDYMTSLGFRWVPTMSIGSGCKTHLADGELPMGRIVASVSRHCVAVIDGVVHDTYDPTREGSRCVYGYWIKG